MKNFAETHLYKLLYLLICVAIAISVFSFEASIRREREEFGKKQTLTLEGTVKSVPSLSGTTLSFTLKTKTVKNMRELIYVRIKHADRLNLCIGDRITLTGTCSAPSGASNPGAFDFAGYIKSKGASLELVSDIAMVHGHEKGYFHGIYSLRQKVSEKVSEHISANEAGLINALITGNKDMISDKYSESYRRAGIYHIVAVSGLHLNTLILFLSLLYAKLRLGKRKKALASLGITLAGCGFMFVFTGFGISVERAAFMALFVCASGLFFREYSAFTSLFSVFAFILITEPRFLSDASFCLSFSATAGILAGAHIAEKLKPGRFKWIWESLIMSLCVNLVTLPFIVHYFGGISLVSPLSNLIVLNLAPVLLALSYMFALVCIPFPGAVTKLFAGMAASAAYCVNAVSDFFASLPFSYIDVSAKTAVAILLCILAALIFVRFKAKAVRIAVIAAIIVANLSVLSYNKLMPCSEVVFLNAGQGDSSLIHGSDGFTAMIDCGSESITNFGENQAVPYLKNKGIAKLDLMIITHFHDDHINGAVALMESGYVKELVLPDRPLLADEKAGAKAIYKTAVRENIPVVHVSAGDILSFGNHRFEILSPQNTRYPNANDGSMVINYEYKENTVLFCGDIENIGQYNLLDTISDCDILKVAHHGGKSYMSQRFSDKVNCDYAVISCGVNNIYSHPDASTVEAYKDSQILRTDTENAPVCFTINSKGIRRKSHAQH